MFKIFSYSNEINQKYNIGSKIKKLIKINKNYLE